MTVFGNKSGDYTPCPEGVHLAVCKYEGLYLVKSPQYSKSADGMLVKQRYIFQTDEKVPGRDQRFEVRASFGCTMGKKSKQRQFIQSWTGKTMTEEQAEKFDSKFMVNRACQINVVHNESGGNIYANVGAVMPLPKGIANPPFEVEWYEWEGKNQKEKWDEEHRAALEWIAAQENTSQPSNDDGGEGLPY